MSLETEEKTATERQLKAYFATNYRHHAYAALPPTLSVVMDIISSLSGQTECAEANHGGG